jgi:hypothetical protein
MFVRHKTTHCKNGEGRLGRKLFQNWIIQDLFSILQSSPKKSSFGMKLYQGFK